jgi:hypothetical protein
MRRVFNGFGRGVAAVAVVCVLSMPVQAAVPRDSDGSWFAAKRTQMVKMLLRLRGAVGSLGDGLIDPRP